MDKEEKLKVLEDAFVHLRAKGIIRNYQEFAALLGISPTGLSKAKNGNETYLTKNLITKVQGLMDNINKGKPEEAGPDEVIPVLPTLARGGTLADFSEAVHLYECEKMLSPIRGADYAMQVTGDSMSPVYPNGSRIIIKKVFEDQFVEWGKVYVLDTDNGPVIKIIRKTDDTNVVECVSINPSYQPFTIPTKYIRGWYRVLCCLTLV